MSATVAGLQNQLNVLHDCTQRLHLNVNLSKTKVVIFRKGGHLSAKEQWVFGNQRLEVVNSYKCLRFVFPTKLSFDDSTNGEHLTRARRGTFEIIKTLRQLGCSSPSRFKKQKLLTHRSCPLCFLALNCGESRPVIQSKKFIHKPVSLFLNESPHTPSDMVYCLFRLQYWFSLRRQPLCRYSRKAYERNSKAKTWVYHVKCLLCVN